jgi:hypothetical protein
VGASSQWRPTTAATMPSRKLQQDLRDRRAPARAAEQLGYRFISRARLTNDPGFYKVAEQAAACLESIARVKRRRYCCAGHRAPPAAPLWRGGRRSPAPGGLREFVLDFGLLGDVLMEQGAWRMRRRPIRR